MSAPLVPLEKLFKQMAETMQAEQNKFDQAVYQSASPTQKKTHLAKLLRQWDVCLADFKKDSRS